jgi:molybdopterin/thiamine biosynthesis adenylyltransferase
VRAREYDEDRFDRMRRIGWLDVGRLRASRCLVAGAGALGNEAVKCLALAGVGRIDVADDDSVAMSNLSRCALFREGDVGRGKAEALASRASEAFPWAEVAPIESRVQDIADWGYGAVLGCLDNVSARLCANSCAACAGVPYVDGATDGLRGKVQVYLPGGPCIECAMNDSHLRIADARFSCAGGGVPFAPKAAAEITTTSVVAAMQAREAMKILSGRRDLCVRGVSYYDGEAGTMETLGLQISRGCPNH